MRIIEIYILDNGRAVPCIFLPEWIPNNLVPLLHFLLSPLLKILSRIYTKDKTQIIEEKILDLYNARLDYLESVRPALDAGDSLMHPEALPVSDESSGSGVIPPPITHI